MMIGLCIYDYILVIGLGFLRVFYLTCLKLCTIMGKRIGSTVSYVHGSSTMGYQNFFLFHA